MSPQSLAQSVKSVEISWLQNAIAAKRTEASEWYGIAAQASTTDSRAFATDNGDMVFEAAVRLGQRLARLEVQA